MATLHGQAYRTLVRAERFAIGPVGPTGRITEAQRALELLVREGGTDTLVNLLPRASLPGQLYALLGLAVLRDPRLADLIAPYRSCDGQLQMLSGCFAFSIPVREIIARIECGDFFEHFERQRDAG